MENLVNHNNPGAITGNITSPIFGHANQAGRWWRFRRILGIRKQPPTGVSDAVHVLIYKDINALVQQTFTLYRVLAGVLFVALVLPHSSFAQQSRAADSELRGFSRRFLQEERDLWTSPLRIHQEDMKWLLPLGAGAAGLVLIDRKVSEDVSETSGLRRPSDIVSQAGAGPLVAVPLSMIALGHFSHNARTEQAGGAGFEAFLHSGLIVQVLKTATNRERPNKTRGDGGFWDGGKSFPSGHAMTTWALAAAMSDQYPDKKWVGVSGYSVATAVSLARVGSLNHFPSDVLVGSSLGWLIGHYVSRHHQH